MHYLFIKWKTSLLEIVIYTMYWIAECTKKSTPTHSTETKMGKNVFVAQFKWHSIVTMVRLNKSLRTFHFSLMIFEEEICQKHLSNIKWELSLWFHFRNWGFQNDKWILEVFAITKQIQHLHCCLDIWWSNRGFGSNLNFPSNISKVWMKLFNYLQLHWNRIMNRECKYWHKFRN